MSKKITLYGVVDPHVHLRSLDWSHKGTFATETAAAIAGGYWAVLDMPNTSPSTIDQTSLKRKLAEISHQAVSDWGLYFGASGADNSHLYSDITADVCGLKIYNNATTGNLLIDDQHIREKHYQAWVSPKPIAVHAEGETVLDILALVRKYKRRTHFCHISTADEIQYLRAAKQEGLPITVGVTPHHLYLNEQDIYHLGPLGLMKPELKTSKDQNALWDALAEGLVDVIESDHAPHTLEEKSSPNPPYGVPGLETTLPLLGLAIHEKRLSHTHLINLVSENPRSIFGLNCPPQTYTVLDLSASYEIKRQNLLTACQWSPFEGMRVYGKVAEVWIRGQQVYDGEKILVPSGFGKSVN